LVIGVASSALFDLTDSDAVFQKEGEEAYRRYQEEHLEDTLQPGVAFPFIRRLLSLNDLAGADDPLVEVIVLSRNDPDTGLRVMGSIKEHGLPITRAIFMQGRAPYKFMPALSMSLFLSASDRDVREALAMGLPAGSSGHRPSMTPRIGTCGSLSTSTESLQTTRRSGSSSLPGSRNSAPTSP
jgi:5'-nucleotidase